VRLASLSLLLIVACHNDPSLSPSASDLSIASDGRDLSTADLSGGVRACAAGCRTFASYCPTAPCVCVALAADANDPPCNATPVSCTIDPCHGDHAVCDPTAGKCILQQ
jgi:hypothetical protein